LPFSKRIKHYSGYILPVVELFAWLGFLIWCLHLIYESEAYLTLIVLGVIFVMLFAPAWFLVRDFFHGLLLKMQRKIEIDNQIEIGDLKGAVVKSDYFTFDIKTSDGKITTVPYNKIRSEIISKNAANNQLLQIAISFQIQSKQDVAHIIAGLKSSLINAPWAAASQEPIINLKNSEDGKHLLEAVIYILKKEHADSVVAYVNQNFIKTIS
jgi:small-conductance mechanosensitive channel